MSSVSSAPAAAAPVGEASRLQAAIAALEALALNVGTMRRGTFPAEARRRMGEVLRLSQDTVDILRRELARVENRPHPPVARQVA